MDYMLSHMLTVSQNKERPVLIRELIPHPSYMTSHPNPSGHGKPVFNLTHLTSLTDTKRN